MSIQVSPSSIPNSDAVKLTSTLPDKDPYLTELLNTVVEKRHVTPLQFDPDWLQQHRDRAANLVRHSTLPTTRDEEWRFTDLSSLRRVQFQSVETQNSAYSQIDVASLMLPEAAQSRLVFVNGVYAPELSTVTHLPDGVVVSNLASLPASETERVQKYLAQAEGKLEVFTALNTAGMLDAAIVWVPKNILVETPIHLVFITAVDKIPLICLPRCLVVAETGSSFTLIEEFISHNNTQNTQEVASLTNAVTEIWVADNAQIDHTRVQRQGLETFHIGKSAISQGRYSRYTCHALTLGAKLSRHNLEVLQTGEQTETTLNGLTILEDNQLADTHSALAFNYPYGTSQQLHKSIVGDRAHSVFNGKIFVPKPAQLTDAAQLNRNLLLSPKARVDTKPQLEITADNVKCAHGATVSQLEDEEIFYFQSRGIDENDARKLLINAFAAEVISELPVLSLREMLTKTVNSKSTHTD